MASKLEVELCQKADLNMAYNRVKVMLSVRPSHKGQGVIQPLFADLLSLMVEYLD